MKHVIEIPQVWLSSTPGKDVFFPGNEQGWMSSTGYKGKQSQRN